MPGFRPPMCSATRGIRCPRKNRADHRSIGATSERLHDISARPHRSVGDHVDVATTGLIEVVASRSSNFRDGGCHGHSHTNDVGGGVARSSTESDEDTRRTRAHQVQRRLPSTASTDDDRDVEIVNELLQIQFVPIRVHVLGGHGRSTDDDDVGTSAGCQWCQFGRPLR